ncbi:hypothetical protein B7494_g6801 [Chlorociboria aeruginascens]|nr:hypothetical protein B7494_g6801 [Chlorociboria aeruginascens]
MRPTTTAHQQSLSKLKKEIYERENKEKANAILEERRKQKRMEAARKGKAPTTSQENAQVVSDTKENMIQKRTEIVSEDEETNEDKEALKRKQKYERFAMGYSAAPTLPSSSSKDSLASTSVSFKFSHGGFKKMYYKPPVPQYPEYSGDPPKNKQVGL